MADRSFHRNFGKQEQQQQQMKGRERSMSLPAALHFNQEIARFSKQKQYDLACQSFERMLNAGVQPDVVTYNTMINVYVKSQRLNDAFSLFEEMQKNKISPTIVTYTSLIDGCGKCNDFGHAMILYEDVKALGISLNMHFFNAILNAGLLNGNVYIIDTVMSDVERTHLKPNTVTFNTLLAGFSRFDQLPRMRDVVEHMINEGVEFSSVTQTTILQAAQLVRDQNDLGMFLDLLDTAKLTPSKNQASQAVMDLISAKRLFVAHQLLTTFLSRNCTINDEVFGAMCRLAGEFGNFIVLQWVIDTARAFSINVEQDVYIAKISILCKFGDCQTAKNMYNSCGANHASIPFDVKLSLADVLFNANDNKTALMIIDHMVMDMQLIEQENSAKTLKLLVHREMNSDALRIYDALKEMLVTFDTNAADSVIQAILKDKITEDRIDSICDLHPSVHNIVQLTQKLNNSLMRRIQWDEMVKGTRVLPHPGEAEELMATLIASNLHTHAWGVFKHFVACGIEATNALVALAFASLQDKMDHEDLILIYNAAHESEIPIDGELGSAVIISAIQSGNIGEALSIYDELDAARVELTNEAKDMHKRVSNTVKFVFQETSPSNIEKPVRGVRTRKRSSTCPRMHLPTPEEGGFFAGPFIADDL